MPAVLNFDELNRFGDDRNPSYEEYFGAVPGLNQKQRADRIRLAERIGQGAVDVFNLILILSAYDSVDWESMKNQLENLMFIAVAGFMTITDDVGDHLRDMAVDIIDVTKKHISEGPDGYFTSEDRARGIGENISEQVWNDEDFRQAIENHKTRKEWVSMKDNRVRDTHAEADGQKRKITDPFVVGDSLLMYPGDWTLGADASELVGCRCGVRYT